MNKDIPTQDKMFEFKTDFGMIRYFENIKLGESNYPVYKGEIKQNGKENWITCAVKKLIIQTKKGDMRINQGVNIFKKLKHKHVVEYYDSEIITISNKNYMHICMELFDASMKDSVDYRKGIKKEKMGKNLDQIIKWLQPRNKFIILKQVVSGLEYLHEKNDDKNPIVHFNLKPANILLKMTNNPFNGPKFIHTAIASFGLADSLNDEASYLEMSDYKGTKDWTSPEVEKYVTNGKTFVGTSSDIYTLGLIFYYFLTDGDKAAERTDFFDDVILKMLSDEPKNRPTASELNSNTLLNQYIQDETLEIEKEEVTNIPDYDSDTDYNSDKTLSEDETTTLIKTVKSEPITEYLTTESKSSTEQKKFNNLTADSGFIEKCDQITESTSMVSNISLTDSSMSNTTEFDLTQKISGDDKAVSFTYEKLLFDNQITEYKFILEDFQFKEIISNSRNIVNKYEHSHSRKIVAIKFVNVPLKRQPRTPIKDKQSKKIEQEVSALISVGNHKNIINCYGMSIQDNKLLICMEHMDLTLQHLYSLAHEHVYYFPENLLGPVATAILNALNFCKSLDYIHRDIKPDNILINWSGEIKLADFGEARILNDSLASTCVGTIRYFSPERFDTELDKYDVRVDVWSLGMTLLECMYGHFPIKDNEGKEMANSISSSAYIKQIDPLNLIKNCPQYYANFVYEFLKLCLKGYADRPKYDVLMKTEFYLKYNDEMSQPGVVASILERYNR